MSLQKHRPNLARRIIAKKLRTFGESTSYMICTKYLQIKKLNVYVLIYFIDNFNEFE